MPARPVKRFSWHFLVVHIQMSHVPVLLKEVVDLLNPQRGETFVDATLGDGGHAIEIIKRLGPDGRFIGIDADEQAIQAAELRIKKQELRIKEVIIVKDNFVNLKNIIQKHNFAPVDGILFDLGLRSEQLDRSGRGFSFLRDEPLDMRFDENGDYPTAAEILNSAPAEELESIFRKFGEERFSKDIAQSIVFARKKAKPRTSKTLGERGAVERLATTVDLVALVLSVYKRRLHSAKDVPWVRGGIHPATRVFQALRIAVNHELENLEKVLPDAVDLLAPGGRLAVIAFHSLEDRIVKHFFRSRREDLKILTKKPITPSEKEIENNPRSRSAKLRVAIKHEL